MKKIYFLGSIILSLFLFAACSSTQNSTTANGKKKSGRDYSTYANLADILRRNPGIEVSGTGAGTTVRIRGMNSIMLDNRPLYVIDGAIIGRDYARANEALNTADIASVRIIKDLAQLNRYGEQGRNGVIYIRSKASQNSKK